MKTLKNCLILLLFSLSFTTVKAQEFSLGPKIGISQGHIRVNGEGFTSTSHKIGYHAGIFARLDANSIFIQPEVLYANTGGEFEELDAQGKVRYSANFNRLDVPIMTGINIAQFFRVQVGPIFSFLLNSDLTRDPHRIGQPGIGQPGRAPTDPKFLNSTLGYQVGVGLDIANIIFDFKYEGPLGSQAESIPGFATDQRQYQLILSLGIRLF
ncbi:MAG: porin family protein [Anditalea sp.]